MIDVERIGDALRELLNQRLLEVTEDPHVTYVEQYDAETGTKQDGIDVVPLRLHFENGLTLTCHVAGWGLERP